MPFSSDSARKATFAKKVKKKFPAPRFQHHVSEMPLHGGLDSKTELKAIVQEQNKKGNKKPFWIKSGIISDQRQGGKVIIAKRKYVADQAKPLSSYKRSINSPWD